VWSGSSGSRLLAALAVCGGACAAVLLFELLRPAPRRAWPALSGGLGTSAHAGVDGGWFLFDARLESQRDGLLGPLPGVPSGDGAEPGGALDPAPLAREPSR